MIDNLIHSLILVSYQLDNHLIYGRNKSLSDRNHIVVQSLIDFHNLAVLLVLILQFLFLLWK